VHVHGAVAHKAGEWVLLSAEHLATEALEEVIHQGVSCGSPWGRLATHVDAGDLWLIAVTVV